MKTFLCVLTACLPHVDPSRISGAGEEVSSFLSSGGDPFAVSCADRTLDLGGGLVVASEPFSSRQVEGAVYLYGDVAVLDSLKAYVGGVCPA